MVVQRNAGRFHSKKNYGVLFNLFLWEGQLTRTGTIDDTSFANQIAIHVPYIRWE